MNRFDLLKQVDISLAARLIVELGNMFQDNSEALEEHLSDEVTEEELHQINDAAQKEGKSLLVFISWTVITAVSTGNSQHFRQNQT